MTQSKKTIQLRHGAVANLISHIKDLPEREKSPDAMLSLSEVFSEKSFISEIKILLKKGYSFGDLAGFIAEKCGISVTERQCRYHFTRATKKSQKRQSSPVESPQEKI